MRKVLKTFFGFIFQRRFPYLGFVALIFVSQILANITPYFFKLFVEEIPKGVYQKLFSILVAYILVQVGSLVFDVLCFWLGDFILFDAAAKARVRIFKQVQDLDFAFHSEKSTGSLISAFKRGDSAFFTLFFEIHHRIINVVIASFVMLYFFTQLDPRISFLVIASFGLTLLVTRFLIGINIKKRAAFNEEEDKVSGIITDNMINYETVKLFAKEKWEQTRLTRAFVPWKKTLWGYGNTFRLIDVVMGVITNLSIFLILLVTLKSASSLELSTADFVLVASFLGLYFPKLWELIWGLRDIAKTYADIEKYFGLLDFEIEVKDPQKPFRLPQAEGKIEFRKVSFSYHGRAKNAIKNLNLKVKPGESIALVGRSGSGKSTLVKLLMRFYDLDEGEITIDGVNIKDLTKSDLRNLIGVVPQEPILFNNTIGFNIGYGRGNTTPGEIKAAARLANIDEFIESLPQKYQTQVGERGVKLSGGQKQRLAIARMILSDPDIIIFDEATSHLDSESERLIQEAFWKAASGKTTIIIAHRLSTIMRTDKIIVLEKGKIKETGTHQNLLTQKDSLYKHLWDLQINLE